MNIGISVDITSRQFSNTRNITEAGTLTITDGSDSGAGGNYGDEYITGLLQYANVILDATDIVQNASTDITWGQNTRLEMDADDTITINSGALIDSTSSGFTGAARSIYLKANVGGAATGDNTDAIYVGGATVRSNTGNIELVGQAMGDGAGANVGIYLSGASGQIVSAGTGANAATITLTGTGGNGTNSNAGVRIYTGFEVTSAEGDISFTGQGGDASGSDNYGVIFYNGGQVSSTGSGADAAAITIVGTAGDGVNNNRGVVVSDGVITTVDGDISVTGHGNGSGSSNYGVNITSSSQIASTGAANISITAPTAGYSSIYVYTGSNIIGGGSATGNITLTADILALANFSIQSSGDVTVQPETSTTTMGIGDGASGTCKLTEAEFQAIDSGLNHFYFGRTDSSGAMQYNNTELESHFGAGNFTLRTSGTKTDVSP